MVTDPDGCLHNNSIWMAISEVPLRKGNTFLVTGGRATRGAKHHNHLPFAGDKIPAKGIEGKLAKIILEKAFHVFLVVRDDQKENSLSYISSENCGNPLQPGEKTPFTH